MSELSYPVDGLEKSVVVIGGGISGLCAAYWLRKEGFSVTVLEQAGEPGGTMKTLRDDGWLIETGPNSALETTPLFGELFHDLGIEHSRVYAADSGANRYIVRGGLLHPLPMTAGAFLRSRLWTLKGKLRLLGEPFSGRAASEESIAQFVVRRLGREFLDYAINPFIAGVYAGDPGQLSVRSALPKLYALEKEYGGLIIGALRSARKRKKRKEIAKDRARLFSFVDGMQTLPRSLGAALGTSVKYGTEVLHAIPQRAGSAPIYTVRYRRDGIEDSIDCRYLVLSTPAHAAAALLQRIDPDTSNTLSSIEYPPVVEVFLGFKNEQIGRPLDGFGFLVPAAERRSILGTIWSSALFAGRSPAGCAALTTFVGGARQPDLVAHDDSRLEELVTGELNQLMGVTGKPLYSRIIRWPKAIPQYTLGYYRTTDQLDRFEKNFQGAYFCGNYRGGIAVGDCLMNARRTADRIIAEHDRRAGKNRT